MPRHKHFGASMVGKAGEYAVASQLISRGVHVYFPACDYGVDLMTESGCRIQVKSAHINTTPKMIATNGEGAYVFPLPKTRPTAYGRKTVILTKRPFAEVCDIVAFWGVEENRFWIVPAHLCDPVYAVVLGRKVVQNKFVGNLKDLFEMKALGYTNTEIGKRYGLDRVSIHYLLKRSSPDAVAEPSAVSLVRACEGAWENVVNFQRRITAQNSEPETAREEVI